MHGAHLDFCCKTLSVHRMLNSGLNILLNFHFFSQKLHVIAMDVKDQTIVPNKRLYYVFYNSTKKTSRCQACRQWNLVYYAISLYQSGSSLTPFLI